MSEISTAKKIALLVKEPIASLGIDLWDVRFVKEGASWYLRIYIDKDGGIGIDDCTEVSHLIDPIIDEADPIGTSYYLEVCSPGIERELITEEHFLKYIGHQVKVKLIRPKDGKKEIIGSLKSYDGDVTVNSDGTDIVLKKDELSSVKLVDL